MTHDTESSASSAGDTVEMHYSGLSRMEEPPENPTEPRWIAHERVKSDGIEADWCVIERTRRESHPARTLRMVADGLTEDEAHLIAGAHALRESLEELLNPVLEGDLPPSGAMRRGMRAFLTSQGLSP